MEFYTNPVVWSGIAIIFVIIGVMLFNMQKRADSTIPTETIPAEPIIPEESTTNFYDVEYYGETPIDFEEESTTLESDSDDSMKNGKRNNRLILRNISSINTAMPTELSDYDNNRFQTPRHHIPTVNLDVNTHIRAS